MKALSSPKALRAVLVLDAVASAVTTLLLIGGAGLLALPFGLPEPFLRSVGLILIPFVLFVGWAATREAPPEPVVWAIISANALWVVASIIFLLGPWMQPTALGTGFVIAQAVAVGLFADLQFIAFWRRRTGVFSEA